MNETTPELFWQVHPNYPGRSFQEHIAKLLDFLEYSLFRSNLIPQTVEKNTNGNQPIHEPVKKMKGAARETLYRIVIRNQLSSIGAAHRKYRLLCHAYHTFPIGMSLTVLTFLLFYYFI